METTIGARIRQLREAKQLSVADFAKAAGVKPSAVYGLESGANKPSLETVAALRQSFPGLNTEWLQFGEGDMFNRVLAPVALPLNKPTGSATTTLTVVQPTREEYAALQEENRLLREQLAKKEGVLSAVEDERTRLWAEVLRKPEASAEAATLFDTVDDIAREFGITPVELPEIQRYVPRPAPTRKEIEGFRTMSVA